MNEFAYDVLNCTAVLPVSGLDLNLFLKCIPNDEMALAVIHLLKTEVLDLQGDNIVVNDNLTGLNALPEYENPSVVLSFLDGLLKEMKACPQIETNQNYISVLQTFQNACKYFCGRNEDIDNQLAELSASLINLLEEPLLHFISEDMDRDNKEYLSVLCNAEEVLVLKVLDRAYETPEIRNQQKLFRFAHDSLQLISFAHHNWIGVNDSTEYVDNLIGLINERLSKLEIGISLEEALAELEQEIGPLPEDDD